MEPFRGERRDNVFDANDAKDFRLAFASSFKPFSIVTESSSFPSFPLSSDASASLYNCSTSGSGIGILESHSILVPIMWGSAEGDLERITFVFPWIYRSYNKDRSFGCLFDWLIDWLIKLTLYSCCWVFVLQCIFHLSFFHLVVVASKASRYPQYLPQARSLRW